MEMIKLLLIGNNNLNTLRDIANEIPFFAYAYHPRTYVDFGITDKGVVDFIHPLPPDE